MPDPKEVSTAVREGKKPDIPYALADMAADAAGLLDALGIESAHIAGCSMGGMIAQLVALDRPEKTRSLISIFSTTSDPSLPPSSPEAQAALLTRPESNDREAVIANSLKGRRTYAFDALAVRCRALKQSHRFQLRPQLLSRRHAAPVDGDPRRSRLARSVSNH